MSPSAGPTVHDYLQAACVLEEGSAGRGGGPEVATKDPARRLEMTRP